MKSVTGKRDLPGGMLAAVFALAFGSSWGILALYMLLTERAAALFGAMGCTNPLLWREDAPPDSTATHG